MISAVEELPVFETAFDQSSVSTGAGQKDGQNREEACCAAKTAESAKLRASSA